MDTLRGGGALKGIKNKAIAYLIPFVSCFIIKLLLMMNLSEITEQICDLPFHLENSLWYLFVLFELSLIHTFSLGIYNKVIKSTKIITKYIIYTLLYGVFLIPQFLFAMILGTGFLGCKYVLYYSIFYWIGFMWHEIKKLYDNFDNQLKLKAAKIINILTVFAVIIYSVLVSKINIYLLSDDMMGIPLRFLASILGVFIVVKTVYTVYNDNSKVMFFLANIGQYTLELYYLHYLFIPYIAQSSLPIFSHEGILSIVVYFSITMLLSFVFIKVISSSPYLSLVIFGKQYKMQCQ